MPLNSFAPSASLPLQATQTSSSVALPLTGSPTTVVVTNLGEKVAFVALGGSTVEASEESMAILAHGSLTLTLGTNTYLAAIALSGVTGLNITAGV